MWSKLDAGNFTTTVHIVLLNAGKTVENDGVFVENCLKRAKKNI
jgi:hypothetical protein